MQFNRYGRRFANGKPLGNDLRELVVVSLLREGADVLTGRIPYGKIKQTAEKCMVGPDTVVTIWKRYVQDQTLEPKRKGGTTASKLGEQEIDLIKHLKTRTPSMPSSDILRVLAQTAYLPSGTSRQAVSRVIVNKLDMSYLLTNWLAYLYGRIQSPRPDVMPDRREGITRAAGFVFSRIDTQAS